MSSKRLALVASLATFSINGRVRRTRSSQTSFKLENVFRACLLPRVFWHFLRVIAGGRAFHFWKKWSCCCFTASAKVKSATEMRGNESRMGLFRCWWWCASLILRINFINQNLICFFDFQLSRCHHPPRLSLTNSLFKYSGGGRRCYSRSFEPHLASFPAVLMRWSKTFPFIPRRETTR